MSTIVLEQIENPEEQLPNEPDPKEEIQPPEITPEPIEAEVVEQEIVPTPPAPAPKKRGRPPKAKVEAPPPAPKVKAAPKPKAVRKPKPPVEESSDSSDVDDTLRNVYNHVRKPTMETAILQFLVNKKLCPLCQSRRQRRLQPPHQKSEAGLLRQRSKLRRQLPK